MTVERFEDLIAWQKARALNRSIYRATSRGAFARDFALRDQVRRASVSVMANIAEGFDRHRDGEFHQYLSMAKGSAAEVRSHLYATLDAEYLKESDFDGLCSAAEEVARILEGLRKSVFRRKPTTGIREETVSYDEFLST